MLTGGVSLLLLLMLFAASLHSSSSWPCSLASSTFESDVAAHSTDFLGFLWARDEDDEDEDDDDDDDEHEDEVDLASVFLDFLTDVNELFPSS